MRKKALSEEAIAAIQADPLSRGADLARKHGVSDQAISQIRHGRLHTPVLKRTVRLHSKGELVLLAQFSPLDISKEDRVLVDKILTVIEEYERAEKQGGETNDERE